MATPNIVALELIQELEEATDDVGFVQRIELRVNEALDEIAVVTNWNHFKTRSTFSTSVGVAQYKMPAGAREIIQLRYLDTGEPIPLLTVQEAARRSIKLEDSGRARAWLEDGNVIDTGNVVLQIRLWPVPAAIASIEREFYYHPSEVASGSQLPIQDQYIVLVKDRVRAAMLENAQMYDAADRAQRRYESNLARLVKVEQSKIADKVVLREVDLANIRRSRGPRLPGNYPDTW